MPTEAVRRPGIASNTMRAPFGRVMTSRLSIRSKCPSVRLDDGVDAVAHEAGVHRPGVELLLARGELLGAVRQANLDAEHLFHRLREFRGVGGGQRNDRTIRGATTARGCKADGGMRTDE